MDPKLKSATDHVMDAFDHAVLLLPGETKEERIVALADAIAVRVMDRAAEAGAIDANPDLNHQQKAAWMKALRMSIEETPGCVASLLVRLTEDGSVKVAGASKRLNDNALNEIATIIRSAVKALAHLKMGVHPTCTCPECTAAHGAAPMFNGTKAQA